MLIPLKRFQKRSVFDPEQDKKYKNHQQRHSLRSQYNNFKIALGIQKFTIKNKESTKITGDRLKTTFSKIKNELSRVNPLSSSVSIIL